jgi:hypothetical protein
MVSILRILYVKQFFKKVNIEKDYDKTYGDTLHKHLLIIDFPK